MPLFCLVNGWLTGNLIVGSFYNMIKKALSRLLLPYFVWSTVAVLAKAVLAMYQDLFSIKWAWNLWVDTILFGTSMWFFPALIVIWFLSWAIYHLAIRSRLLAMVAMGIVLFLPLQLESRVYAFRRVHDLLPIYYLGFIARTCDTDHQKVTRLLKSRKILIISFSLFLILPWLLYVEEHFSESQTCILLQIIFELVGISAVFIPCCWLIHKSARLESFISVLGIYSLDIYCIHMAFVEYFRFQMPERIVKASQLISAPLYFLEAVMIAVISAMIAFVIGRVFPLYKWIMSGRWPKENAFTWRL